MSPQVAGGEAAGGSGGSATGGRRPVTVTYGAEVADCLLLEDASAGGGNPLANDPDICAAVHGGNRMGVDLFESDGMGLESRSYLRYEIDDQLADLEITGLTIRTFVGETGPEAGEIWAVEPFSRPDLFMGPPGRVDVAPLAPSYGPVTVNTSAEWTLPPTIIDPPATLFIEIAPVSTTTEGVDYHNNLGATPPVLVVTGQ